MEHCRVLTENKTTFGIGEPKNVMNAIKMKTSLLRTAAA